MSLPVSRSTRLKAWYKKGPLQTVLLRYANAVKFRELALVDGVVLAGPLLRQVEAHAKWPGHLVGVTVFAGRSERAVDRERQRLAGVCELSTVPAVHHLHEHPIPKEHEGKCSAEQGPRQNGENLSVEC